MKFGGIMIGTSDSKRLGAFYTEVLGKPDWDMDDWFGWGKDGANMAIGPHSEVTGKSQNPQRLMITMYVDDVKAESDRIKGIEGVEVVAKPYQPMAEDNPDTWLATFADPDGNYFQVSTPWEG